MKNKNTENQIKNRMLKKAASLWGVPAKEIETSFDPVVSMLISACASEIEKVTDKVNASQTNITERVIQLMTPDTIFSAKPSHGILHVEPIDNEVVVDENFMFSCKKRVVDKAEVDFKTLFFSPIQEFKTVKTAVQYVITRKDIYQIDALKNSESLLSSNEPFLEPSELYLGLTTSSSQLSLKNTSFYFELQDFENTKLFYHHLKDAKWSSGNKEIPTKPGLYNSKTDEEIVLDAILDEDSVKVSNVINQVKNNYARHYVTLLENVELSSELPPELEDTIQKNRIKIDKDVVWIKIEFPRVISSKVLKTVFCSVNSFPVINRKEETFSYKLKEYINIVPINVNDLFLDIKSIINLDGKKYKLLNKNTTSKEKGVYSLKTDSIARLDNRKAKDYLQHLISLLKDESASFSFLKNDFLHNNLKSLNQSISLLENKINETKTADYETQYISVIPYQPNDTLTVSYWTTNGNFANSIKYGSAFKLYKGIGLKQKSAFLVTSTYGGRNELTMNERLQAYRRTLLSRNRIVTKEDVKATCYEFLGNKIVDVVIQNGYTVDVSLHKGIINCIEIILTPNDKEKTDMFEWDFLKNNLLLYLEKHSVNVFPYVIKFKERS